MDREEFAKLLSGREQWKSEEDVREGILGALKTLGLYFEVHEGIAQVGRVVLKFARRECFRGRGQGSTLANALAYLAGYVQKRARRGLPCAGIPLCRDRWRNNGPRAHDRGREHDSGVVCAALP